jgi:hypothetical protein
VIVAGIVLCTLAGILVILAGRLIGRDRRLW